MKLVIVERWKDAVRPGPDTGLRHILWPASFPGTSRARIPAHALAGLLFTTAMCQAFLLFYWADNAQVRGEYRRAALWLTSVIMAVPVLLMREVLKGALRGWKGAWYKLLTAAAWIPSVPALFLVLLLVTQQTRGTFCTGGTHPPEHPLPEYAVPLCIALSLAAGSSAAWLVWVVSRRRARSVHLYRAWLAALLVTLVAGLAPWLESAQTCRTGA
ncbi:hypothetical protein [Streptomyces sp. NPDC001388]|uniref:hypothetical protein n=1 Tax=Streptomyces sp. NPDC001388 TaxID=3364568 RepID=UPI0036B2C8BB